MTSSFDIGARAGMEKVAGGTWDWMKAQAGKVMTRRDAGAPLAALASPSSQVHAERAAKKILSPNILGRFFMSAGNQAQAAQGVTDIASHVMANAATPAARKGMGEMVSQMSGEAVKGVMTPANKKWFADASSEALDQTLNRNRQLIADVANEAVSKSLSPDNASKLIGQTLTRAWKPLAVAGMGAGVMLGAGAGIGIALGHAVINRSKSFREKAPVVKHMPIIGLAKK